MSALGGRLSLGTAQWGTGYGITNAKGALDDSDIADIVTTALEFGIHEVDTHRTTNARHGYGRAQARLRPWASEFTITTKVFGGSAADGPISEQIADSLANLGVERVHACLVHDWSELSNERVKSAVRELIEVRDQGLVQQVGIAAYDEFDLAKALDAFGADLGVIQAPASVVDQRLVGSRVIEQLQEVGTEIQVRSIFLQGLLLAPTSSTALAGHPAVTAFQTFCSDRELSPVSAALSFIRSLEWAAVVVVGVTEASELAQIATAWQGEPVPADWAEFASNDGGLLDPRRWSSP